MLQYSHMYTIETTTPEADYELIDSGNLRKLERYGPYVLSRPDPQALWLPRLTEKEWRARADAWFVREGAKTKWQTKKEFPKEWQILFGGFALSIRPNSFKHTGLFPEQRSNWEWIQEVVTKEVERRGASAASAPQVLNLFGYTGGASLAAAKAGGEVCHIDGSKSTIAWFRDNIVLSQLEEKKIRSLCEDVRTFLKREIKRGNKYDAVIMDPPAFGSGADGEVWKMEEHFLELLDLVKKVLTPQPLFVLINGYASGYSSVAYANALLAFQKEFGGTISHGELAIRESGDNPRLLPCGIFARFYTDRV